MAANSAVRILIWSKFELIRAFIVILVTYKNQDDPIKNEETRVLTRLYIDFFRHLKAATSAVSGGIG